MARTDDVDLQRWVDDRLERLAPAPAWDPSVTRGLERLRRGQGHPGRRWMLWMAGATAAVVLATPTPVLRAFVHECGALVARFATSSRRSMPDVALRGADGQPVTVPALRGRVVLLSFWPDTCEQCRTEERWFDDFERTYRARGLVRVRADVDPDGWPPAIDRSKPTTLILARDGRIAVRHAGYCSREEYQRDIVEVLAEK
jgi:thiol-disulfide isomerase/thioredoxin